MMLENLQVVVRLGHEPTVSCYIVNPVSKSSMTIRHCFWHSDLVSYPSFYISSNISISQVFLSSTLMSPWILYFFLLSLHQGQPCRKCFIVGVWSPHAAFLHVGGFSFFDIECAWVNLVCPIRILLSLTLYCLQLLYALSHSSMRDLTQYSLLVMFSHSLCHSELLALLMVKQQSIQGSVVVVIPNISIACLYLYIFLCLPYVCCTVSLIFLQKLYSIYQASSGSAPLWLCL